LNALSFFSVQYRNEKLAGNIYSEDSSKSTPKKKKGHSKLLEKSPVTPPDVLRDTERGIASVFLLLSWFSIGTFCTVLSSSSLELFVMSFS
jgi:hypothetical protein